MEDNNQPAREFLERVREEHQALATLADAELDELVIVAVESKVTPDKPAYARVRVMARNETLGGVLLKNSRHKFSNFPSDSPCLRFNPPIIDEYWPERNPEYDDPELAERFDPPHFPY